MVADVQEDDEGVYTCQVITKLDMAEASGSITLVGEDPVPVPPPTWQHPPQNGKAFNID